MATVLFLDENFSGEITYRGEYCLQSVPQAGERYYITLEDTSVSASVVIDAEPVANVGMTPMRALIPGEKLKQRGQIEIIVANTAANEILAKHDEIHEIPDAELGPYYPRMYQFEAARPLLKLGKVTIEKIKVQ